VAAADVGIIVADCAIQLIPSQIDVRSPALFERPLLDVAPALRGEYLRSVEVMALMLEARDRHTAEHSSRAAVYSVAVAKELGLPDKRVEAIRVAAQLHDVGKIGIPDSVLRKPGPLTPEEFDLLKTHTKIGRAILERAGLAENILAAVELHHESVNGSGYPYGLRGDQTPLEARVIRVADVFDAMTSHRPYREALRLDTAMEELERQRGRLFDVNVVNALLRVLQGTGYLALISAEISAYAAKCPCRNRPGAGRGCTWCRLGASAPSGRIVRAS
jgi:putative nucleotidyltransferase with HDIG domain